MRRLPAPQIALFAVLAAAIPTAAVGQVFPTPLQRPFSELKAQVPRDDASVSQRIQLQWFAPAGPERAAARSDEVRVVSRVRGEAPLAHERDPQLSTDHVVVVSSDAA